MKLSISRLPDWSLALGGIVGVGVGILVLGRGQQPFVQRGFVFLIGACLLALGSGRLVEPRRPLLAARLKFLAKILAGLALFSLSWAISHRS